MIYKCKLKTCGKEFQDRPSINRRYCSNRCHAKARSRRPDSVGIKSACRRCGKEFYSRPHRAQEGRGKFCSKKCAHVKQGLFMDYAWLRQKFHDESLSLKEIARQSKASIKTISKWVGVFGFTRKRLISDEHRSRLGKIWLGRQHKPETKEKIRMAQLGPLGHNWKGGHRVKARFQPPWKTNRRLALIRDGYSCQQCGRLRSNGERGLDVHHKIPFRCFSDHRIAHELNNLQTLCRQCHLRHENMRQMLNARFGSGCSVWYFVNIYGATFGDRVSIGSHTEVGKGVVVGNDVAIGSQSFIPEGYVIGSNVFLGPRFCGTNDRYPPTPKDRWVPLQTVIEDDVSIGASVILLPGIRIGRGARIAAGSIVTKDVAPGSFVRGEPSRARIMTSSEQQSEHGWYN